MPKEQEFSRVEFSPSKILDKYIDRETMAGCLGIETKILARELWLAHNAAFESRLKEERKDAAVKALEMAKEEIQVAANTRKCTAYGHDERYCAYCSDHEDGTDMAHAVVCALADRVRKGEEKI